MEFDIIDSGYSEDCGCPEERLIVGMVEAFIHLEPDGTGEVFLDVGDWQDEITLQCDGIEDLRAKAKDYIQALPTES